MYRRHRENCGGMTSATRGKAVANNATGRCKDKACFQGWSSRNATAVFPVLSVNLKHPLLLFQVFMFEFRNLVPIDLL